MSTENLEAAIESTRAVLAATHPDQYRLPTPCASWDLQAVVNHLVGEAPAYFVSICKGEPPASPRDLVPAGDALWIYDTNYAMVLTAFQHPGLLETTLTAEFGQIPAAAFLGVAINDVFVHGWDLAKATGQSTDLDPSLAEYLLEFAKVAIQDAFRGPEGALFGVEQQAPDGASPADRLAAFLGRTV